MFHKARTAALRVSFPRSRSEEAILEEVINNKNQLQHNKRIQMFP
jgi:hypothetical protein